MLGRSFPTLGEIRVHDAHGDVVERVVARAREAGIPARAAAGASEAVDGADVIVTATQATEPLFGAAAVSPRALICAVGATKHDRCEIAPEVVARCASVVCDDVAGSRVECGDLIRAAAHGRFGWDHAVELHAVAAGTAVVERAGAAPVLFETQGVALQDVAAAGRAWERWIVAQCSSRTDAAVVPFARAHRPDEETAP
jgi:ornithine cyclodeaminase